MRAPASPDTTAIGDLDAVYGCFDNLAIIAGAFEGPDHVVVAVNAAAREILGGRDVLGRPAAVGIPELATQEYLELLDRTYKTGEPFTATEWRNQLYVMDGDPTEIYMNMELIPWRDADGGVRGVLTQVTDVTAQVEQRQASEAEAAELEHRYQAAVDVVATLQTALLSTRLPVLPDLRVAARYLVAAEEQAAGGDWFDAIVLDDNRVALVVGDVVGHGVVASAVMAQLRAVLLELLTSEPDLFAVLERIDHFATYRGGASAATLCVVLLDPTTGRVEYGTCGHPPPLLLQPDGSSRFLDRVDGGPLGSGIVSEVGTALVDTGGCVLLYTDGLVERPDVLLDESLARMARVAASTYRNEAMPIGAPLSPAHRLCDQTLEMMTRTGYLDDVTVLAAQRRPVTAASLHIAVDPTPGALGDTRRQIRAWLDDLDMHPDDMMNLQLAATEVVTNSIEHAYAGIAPQPIHVEVVLQSDGRLRCTVDDHGVWQEPKVAAPDDERQRGLALVSQISDELKVGHDGDGTQVRFMQRPRSEAVVDSPTATSSRPMSVDYGEPACEVRALDDPIAHLRLVGPFDLGNAEHVDAALRQAARGGTMELVLDLGGVPLLTSAGVQVLVNVSRLLRGHGRRLRLVAPGASPAEHVLKVVGLDYHTTLAAVPTS